MNQNTRILFAHKALYDVYFYGAITIPFFVSKGYGVSAALTFASLYMITSMAMEVPTGFIGDLFGHKKSVFLGAFFTGVALTGLVLINNVAWDAVMIFIFASSTALASGSDVALLRNVSDNFERDNRIFDYLKSVMLLVSFAAAGFVVRYLSIDLAIGLSAVLAFASLVPLLFVHDAGNTKPANTASLTRQVLDLPQALQEVSGGLSLILLAGMVGAVTFSAKEIISSFNTIYDLDIQLVGIVAALAMAGRIVGTALEEKLQIKINALLVLLSAVIALTSLIQTSLLLGVVFVLLSTIIAQMLFYNLRYRLSSEAPQTHVASLVSGLSLVGRLCSGVIIFAGGLFAGAGNFEISFILIGLVIVVFGGFLAHRITLAFRSEPEITPK